MIHQRAKAALQSAERNEFHRDRRRLRHGVLERRAQSGGRHDEQFSSRLGESDQVLQPFQRMPFGIRLEDQQAPSKA
jgi:hypothetical protein